MVDVDQIQELLSTHFKLESFGSKGDGSFHIDATSGKVSVQGSVTLRSLKVSQLPVKFHKVMGHFKCQNNTLTTLAGAPDYVGSWFECSNNRLTSLAHGPQHVGGSYVATSNLLTNLLGAPTKVGMSFFCRNNPLISLTGAPEQIAIDKDFVHKFECDYHAQLPLLRLLNYETISLLRAPRPVNVILKRYLGQGKQGAIKCAAELVKAGYKDNARW